MLASFPLSRWHLYVTFPTSSGHTTNNSSSCQDLFTLLSLSLKESQEVGMRAEVEVVISLSHLQICSFKRLLVSLEL